MLTHEDRVKRMLSDPAVKAEFDVQAEEFALLDELLRARQRAGLTQAEVAKSMGTKTPAAAQSEAGGGSKKHSPSVATLRRYVEAVGCRLEIRSMPTGGSTSEFDERKTGGAKRPRPERNHQLSSKPRSYLINSIS